jgi:hypothetical protein
MNIFGGESSIPRQTDAESADVRAKAEAYKKDEFKRIVSDSESAAAAAFEREDYVQSFILVHVLIESLLRAFLEIHDDHRSFSSLIDKYESFLRENYAGPPTFVNDLRRMNQRRNRIVHELWQKGFTGTNKQAGSAAHSALGAYGLLIEWLGTLDRGIGARGFKITEPDDI